MKVLLIRKATEADLPQLVDLYRQLELGDAAPRGDAPRVTEEERRAFAEVRADEHQEVLVAELRGEVVGTFVLLIVPNVAHGCSPWALVENVVVDETRRGAGAGKAMMEYARARAAGRGCYKLVLSSNMARSDAHRFYESLGWQRSHFGFTLSL